MALTMMIATRKGYKHEHKYSLIDAEGRLHCIICGEEHPESKRSYKKSKLKKVM